MASDVLCLHGEGSRPSPNLQSVPDFCTDNGVSRSLFYRLVKEGRGPRLTKVARRTLVSSEAAAEWRTRMEHETAQAAALTRASDHRGRRGRREKLASTQGAQSGPSQL